MTLDEKVAHVLAECGACALDDEGDRAKLATTLRRVFGEATDRCSPHCPGWFLSEDEEELDALRARFVSPPLPLRIIYRCDECDVFEHDGAAAEHVFSRWVREAPPSAPARRNYAGVFDAADHSTRICWEPSYGMNCDLHAPRAFVAWELVAFAEKLERETRDQTPWLLLDGPRAGATLYPKATLDKLKADANNALTPIVAFLDTLQEEHAPSWEAGADSRVDPEAFSDAWESAERLRALFKATS